MSMWSRIRNVFRSDEVNRELDEELQAHLKEASARGREKTEVRRALGSPLRHREASRDSRMLPWLDSLRADVIFGWRQLKKNRAVSVAAILSLGLAIGSCTAAFRLVDALLLRPLPVASPERLRFVVATYVNERTGKPDWNDASTYPLYRLYREALKDRADALAIGYSSRNDLTFTGDAEMEKAYRQYVSGNVLSVFGLKPALGRLLLPSDDVTPGAHPVAVLSHDYWTRRFGQDPNILGKAFRMDEFRYEIVGVLEPRFTGTETGTITDIFIPTMMNSKAIDHKGWSWFRTWIRLKDGVRGEEVRERLQAVAVEHRRERIKDWPSDVPQEKKDAYVNSPISLYDAGAGVSGMQKSYKTPLAVLGVVVGLVLLIACANVANLLTAQAAARAREMALRVSIGAGRWRLIQLVMVESVLLAALGTALGALFAWWSAPFVVTMLGRRDEPIRLILSADWRVLAFAAGLAIVVALLFGLAPAMRASAVKPMSALKGGEDPHARRRLMNGLVAAQVAFCFLVHFGAGLFVATFERLANQPVGFDPARLLALEVSSKSVKLEQQPWQQVANHLLNVPGVQSVALCGWAPMSGNGWTQDILLSGKRVLGIAPYFLSTGPGWLDTMKIPLIAGRDFRPEDRAPAYDMDTKEKVAGVAIVNEAFAREYFRGENPVGRTFEKGERGNINTQVTIVGYVKDARYRDLREPIRPTAYVPFGKDSWGTVMVRTTSDQPMALATILRQEVQKARTGVLVSNINTQSEIVAGHTIRERMLAVLSMFFAIVALILAVVGLYGVLNYSVIQRTREIGIRMALGARPANVVKGVTAETFGMLILGSFVGLAAGMASERYVETLLYSVKASELSVYATPAITLTLAAILAALPPVIRAVRIDPAQALRAE